jgi:manganese/zinc/iron transport system permease protein
MLDQTLLTVMAGAAILGAVAGSLGCFAVLRKQSLVGDALAHAALPGVCLAYLVGSAAGFDAKHPLLLLGGAMATAWLGTLAILAITRTTRLKDDAALGIVLSVFFGTGVVLLTHIQQGGAASQAGLNRFLFGQAASLLPRDVLVMALLGGAVMVVLALFFQAFRLLVFDPGYAAARGLPVWRAEVLLTTLIVVTVVVGLQTVGVVLMAAMVVAPAATARQWTDRLPRMVVLGGAAGALAGALGAWLSSLERRLPTGPIIVLVSTGLLAASLLVAPRRGLLWAAWRRVRNRRRVRVENLLKDLWRLGEMDAGRFGAPRAVSDVLAVRAAPARAVEDARADGLVRVEGPLVELTEAGLARAGRVVRNHRVWESYLSRRLDLRDDHLHRDAEDMEHALDDEVLEQIDRALGRPATDPHGRPIPRGTPS